MASLYSEQYAQHVKYRLEFNAVGSKGVKYRADILTSYGIGLGLYVDVNNAGERVKGSTTPVKLTRSRASIVSPMYTSTATVELYSDEDSKYLPLTEETDAVMLVLSVHHPDTGYWMPFFTGVLDPEQYGEPYSRRKGYMVRLVFQDFGVLKRQKHKLRKGTSLSSAFASLVNQRFEPCSYMDDLPFSPLRGFGRERGFDKVFPDFTVFQDKDKKPMSSYTVLETLCRNFGVELNPYSGEGFGDDLANVIEHVLDVPSSAPLEVGGTDLVFNKAKEVKEVIVKTDIKETPEDTFYYDFSKVESIGTRTIVPRYDKVAYQEQKYPISEGDAWFDEEPEEEDLELPPEFEGDYRPEDYRPEDYTDKEYPVKLDKWRSQMRLPSFRYAAKRLGANFYAVSTTPLTRGEKERFFSLYFNTMDTIVHPYDEGEIIAKNRKAEYRLQSDLITNYRDDTIIIDYPITIRANKEDRPAPEGGHDVLMLTNPIPIPKANIRPTAPNNFNRGINESNWDFPVITIDLQLKLSVFPDLYAEPSFSEGKEEKATDIEAWNKNLNDFLGFWKRNRGAMLYGCLVALNDDGEAVAIAVRVNKTANVWGYSWRTTTDAEKDIMRNVYAGEVIKYNSSLIPLPYGIYDGVAINSWVNVDTVTRRWVNSYAGENEAKTHTPDVDWPGVTITRPIPQKEGVAPATHVVFGLCRYVELNMDEWRRLTDNNDTSGAPGNWHSIDLMGLGLTRRGDDSIGGWPYIYRNTKKILSPYHILVKDPRISFKKLAGDFNFWDYSAGGKKKEQGNESVEAHLKTIYTKGNSDIVEESLVFDWRKDLPLTSKNVIREILPIKAKRYPYAPSAVALDLCTYRAVMILALQSKGRQALEGTFKFDKLNDDFAPYVYRDKFYLSTREEIDLRKGKKVATLEELKTPEDSYIVKAVDND